MAIYEGLLGFIELFDSEEACKDFLCEHKWAQGFECRQCGHTKLIKGATVHHRRCQRCKYDESCTSHTLFHKIKFPLQKAFTIVYQLSTMKKGLSTCEIARQFTLHQETAWYFKQKVKRAMSASEIHLLENCVEVDESVIGGYEVGQPGRSHGKKKKVQIAVEIDYPESDDNPSVKRASAQVISDYTTKELSRSIDEMIATDALIVTDGLQVYVRAVGSRLHDQWPSALGANFKKLHWHIFNLKNWLRGIHHHISEEHLQSYLDEFHFRFNNRNWIPKCPDIILNWMVRLPWTPYKQLRAA